MQQRSIWLWSLAPIFFAALRVLVVSRGDPETLRALVQNLNVTALVLATLLPVAATLAFWVMLPALLVRVAMRGQGSKGVTPLFVLIVILTLILVWFAMPLRHIAFSAAIFGTIAAIMFCASRFHRMNMKSVAKFFQTGVALSVLALVVAAFVSLLGQSDMWLPKEQITVGNTETIPVYILSSDERWTTYMDDHHKVHIVSTPDITHRDAVGSSGSVWNKSLADFVRCG
jgi:hypothetical protein